MAALANGLVTLYEATFDERWLVEAAALLDVVLERFDDAEKGGFFYTADDAEQLIVRNKDLTDNATPGGNSLAATAMVRLGIALGGGGGFMESANHAAHCTAAARLDEAVGAIISRWAIAHGFFEAL